MKELGKCDKPVKLIKIGRFRIGYIWSNVGLWENDILGFRETYYFKLYKVYDDSRSAIGLVIGNLSLHFSTASKMVKK